MVTGGWIRSVRFERDGVADLTRYPFDLPAVRELDELALDPGVTVLVGENGSGKSTLVEAIAVAAGFNPEGGSANFTFSTGPSVSPLHRHLRLVRSPRRPATGFFLRAESFFNVASAVDDVGVAGSYGGRSLHDQSHGESFLSLVLHRFGADGLYVMDEPEAALSPQGCLALIAAMHDLVGGGEPVRRRDPLATADGLPRGAAARAGRRRHPRGRLRRPRARAAVPLLPRRPRAVPADPPGRLIATEHRPAVK